MILRTFNGRTSLLAVAIVLAAAAVGYGLSPPPRAPSAPDANSPAIEAPTQVEAASFSATGIVKPQVGAEVKVGSQVSGIVVKLNVRVGDKVDRDQELARVDDAPARAAVDTARADLQAANAESAFAAAELSANEKLRGVVSSLQMESLRRNATVRDADVARAKARLADAEIQYGRTRIRSPISGTIASVSTYEGETVAASFTAPTFVTIVDLDRLEVQAFVDETDIRNVTIGHPVTFRLEAFPDRTLSGTVIAIQPKAELVNNVVTYIVIVQIRDSKGLAVRPEMTARLNFARDRKAAIGATSQ